MGLVIVRWNRGHYILYICMIVFLRLVSTTFLGACLPVPSSLNLPLWRSTLRDYDDYAVCNFLEFGWPVGLNYASSLSTDQVFS